MRRTTLAALCIAAATATALTGCQSGSDSSDGASRTGGVSASPAAKEKEKEPFAGLTGGQIADRALAATTGASSLRLKGDVPDEESGGTITLDVALDKKGECAGSLSMNGQGRADLIKTGDTIYMKYDEAFLRAQSKGESKDTTDAVVNMLAGKWTKTSATGKDAMDISGFCDLDTVLGGADEGSSAATRGRTTTVGGTPAIVLTEQDGKDRYTVYVATQGEPYLLRIDSASAGDPGTLAFSDYEKPVPAQKPSGTILDLDELG
ncbi:hypothetical protein [Streptomyces longwoodensis]|uniref:hypothetical protein n=1 Tax=Streptomyces longwoodensis TaxID=68231 RepID=UPI0037F99604